MFEEDVGHVGEDVGAVGEDKENSGGDVDDSDDLLDSDYDMEKEWGDDDQMFQRNIDPWIELGGDDNIEQESSDSNETGEDDLVASDDDLDEHRFSNEDDEDQAYRAKKKALKAIEGSPDYQYTRLWDYADELRRTNPGSTIILGTEDDSDGVRFKNKETWEWFLTVLKNDLEIVNEHEFTFMSDKQKGLILAFEEVFPGSDHRFCVRHLLYNFKIAGYRGMAFKNALWSAAKATTVNEFKLRMQELRQLDESAEEWFHDKPPVQWTRSHFSEYPKCDMLLNNVCEVFNSNILDARKKPIITMLEWIRQYLMKRLQENRDRAESKWQSRLCPKIRTIIEKYVAKVGDCIPIKADNRHYQISVNDENQYCVDLSERSCTCRKWGLSGIPYKHAISAIFDQREVLEDYVDECYSVDTYKRVYAPAIMGINGEHLWGDSMYIPPLPPNFGRGASRPAKARRMEPGETAKKGKKRRRRQVQKLRRQGTTVICRKCGVEGHNSTTCSQGREETAQDGQSDPPNRTICVL
ncbi:hypothetical protein BUALT_Bualt12G0136100 [Buddleja alternifolia]|uniref:SWIM-type domain-containing protein n=1 Tax=Buddleja alternifolia TaxID=168488 RepID=A0AAV6WPZ9_9LAMI|nr:hypothetical protein BUALT_Bualt12G0136100 [Buddleja alternifolia]